MDLLYKTRGIQGGEDRFFKIKKKKNKKTGDVYGEVSRISCAEYDDPKQNPIGLIKPKIGNKVIIIIKPYRQYICKTGIVKKLLTQREVHSRGHKVQLSSGEIGRTLKILEK